MRRPSAGRIYGLVNARNLGLPDARLGVSEGISWRGGQVFASWQPQTVILPYWEGRHPDHYNAARWLTRHAFWRG